MTDRRHLVRPIPTPARLAWQALVALATVAIFVACCWLAAAAI